MKPPETEERLAGLLAELIDQVRHGRRPDLETVAREHPDLAAELRSLWPAILIADELARPGADEAAVGPTEDSAPNGETAALPSLFGDYELLEELGQGGMGVVYKARQRTLGRTVAIKLMLRGQLATTADRERFRKEAESAARLDHAGIVPVHEIGEHEGQMYFTMKYVEGRTLAQLTANGPLPSRDAARYVLAVARAVHHAHENGILHRDLKPSNVIIDQADQAHVTDFGLAKTVRAWERESVGELERKAAGDPAPPSGALGRSHSLTQSGAILGTPSYMPPEQATGNRGALSRASDVYSLGALLYHLLTGRPPFQAASPWDTFVLVLEQDPVPPRLLNPKVDRELEMICLKCLQKSPSFRYASAAQLADDLEAFLHDEPVSARSWSLGYFFSYMLRPTHHVAVLENWGVLWMWHSLKIFLLCAVTNWMHWQGEDRWWPYFALWSIGLVAWGAIFWKLRRRGGPILFVERQIAHAWGAGIAASIMLFGVEAMLGLPVLTLSPVLAIFAGMVFTIKAGTLCGTFYLEAAVLYGTAILMAVFPAVGPLLFGIASAACFFWPGVTYYRQRLKGRTAER